MTSTAMPSSTTSFALMGWSSCIGRATIGTPNLIASMTELHPQCERKPPILGWVSISLWGAHPVRTKPTSRVLSMNPQGINGLTLSSSSSSSPTALGNLITHMKLTLLSSNPMEISSISSSDKKYSLPKEANTTEELSFSPIKSITFLLLWWPSSSKYASGMRGPTGTTSLHTREDT
ncbi:flavanone 7-O-glucoside 2''-O-beta-L-rhamnosyltransferase-like [Iris pallida]|uniref:Flavanone 7-O-glucoside 2''-O-beta-L-rhamnosyltransferase-like n=1 Tax=Iris pallida TaxID=29817 RepID=A0AAX6IFJ9_IRIPA|nr:flavanone 7-O-glucoside 2''-O-beta-L-rhamnosyltransferase-like [Iris pallida]